MEVRPEEVAVSIRLKELRIIIESHAKKCFSRELFCRAVQPLRKPDLTEDMPEMDGSGTSATLAGEIAENDEMPPPNLSSSLLLFARLLVSPSSLAVVVAGRGLMPEI